MKVSHRAVIRRLFIRVPIILSFLSSISIEIARDAVIPTFAWISSIRVICVIPPSPRSIVGIVKHRMLFHAYSRILSDNALHRASVSVSGFSEERDRSTFVDGYLSVSGTPWRYYCQCAQQLRVARATSERRTLIFHRIGLRLLRTLSGYHIRSHTVPTNAAYTYI